MKLFVAIVACTAALASAKRSVKNIPDDLSNVEIKAESKTGNRLLSKARRLDGADEYTWIAGYSLKFESCVAFQDYYGGQFAGNGQYYGGQGGQGGQYYQNGQYAANAYGGAEDGGNRKLEGNYAYYGNGYYNNEQREDYQGMYQQQLVKFKLCPSDSRCYSCKNGAEYVVALNEFVDAILDAKKAATEYKCEQVSENCWCDNAQNGEQACLYNCFKNAGLADCMEDMYEDEFDMQDAVECTQIEVEDEDAVKNYYFSKMGQANMAQYGNAQNGNYQNGNYQNGQNGYYMAEGQEMGEIGQLWVGPYCTKNGKAIHLGVFMEETCSFPAPEGIYEAVHYGSALPYSKESIVDHKCYSCKQPKEIDYDNYWEQQQDVDEATEVCLNLYEVAGKCEEKLDGYFPMRDVTGCNFIKTLKASGMDYPRSNTSAKVVAGVLGVTTAVLAGVAFVLAKKNRRQGVSLAGDAIIS